MAGVTMKLERNGVTIGYDDAGSGEPALVLIHGWATDRAVMRPLFERAQVDHRVLALDLPGFGRSGPSGAHAIGDYADDLAFLIDGLRLERPIVVGHSMGGMVAYELAARHPDPVGGAVILEAMLAAPERLAALVPVLDHLRSGDHREVVTRLMRHLAGTSLDEGARERLFATALACRRDVLIESLARILAFEATRPVECPMLYVGTDTEYADLDRLRALCPRLATATVGGGHYSLLEAPDEVFAHIA